MRKLVVLLTILLVLILGLGLYLQANMSGSLSTPDRATATASNTSHEATSTRSTASNQATATPSNPFDPARFGLPPTITGYKVLVVLTSDNSACVPAGSETVVLQSTQPYTVEESLSYSGAQDAAIKADLDKRGLSASDKVSWTIVGPGITRDQVMSEIQSWNKQRWTYGCVTSGPAPPTTVK